MSKNYINVHHSADFASDGEKQFQKINLAHKARWGGKTKSSLGFYGGYHYLVERDGEVKKYRQESEIGAHNNIAGMNVKAIGICFAGNFSEQELSKEQVTSGLKLIEDVMVRNNIPESNVKAHRHYKATQCWGMNNPEEDIIGFLRSKLEVEGSQPSDWALESIDKAKKLGITNWENPKELVNNDTLNHTFAKLKLINAVHPNGLSKEAFIHALDKAGHLDPK